MHPHTHLRIGFSDYKLLIHAATDNPLLLYYIFSITDSFRMKNGFERHVEEARVKCLASVCV
jgi:hypothetical protein